MEKSFAIGFCTAEHAERLKLNALPSYKMMKSHQKALAQQE